HAIILRCESTDLGLCFSPDATALATFGSGVVRVIDIPGGTLRASRFGKVGDVSEVAFSPDGTVAAVPGEGETGGYQVLFWRLSDGNVAGALPDVEPPITFLAYTPDGGRIVVGGWKHGLSVRNLSDGKQLANLTLPKVCCAALRADGKEVIAGL